MKIEILDEVSSTNEYIRRYFASGEDRIVVAKRQTGGKGTKGRSFASEEGGIYLSALNFYSDFPARNAFYLMAHAAVAVCRTAEAFSLSPEIKWPNDVYLNGKKLAGILVENILENNMVNLSVTGIGVNVSNDVRGLNGIATSLSEETGKTIPVESALEILIGNLQQKFDFNDYLARVRFLKKEVSVVENGTGEQYTATAMQILSDGRLCVFRGEQEVFLSAAEISLKI